MEIINHKDKYYLKTETGYREILASTDSSIIFNQKDFPVTIPIFPQIPQQFIEEYISEYNRGNVIKDVEVEYEEDNSNLCDCYYTKFCKSTQLPKGIKCRDVKYWKLKFYKDNFISIKRKETKLYTREEVVELCKNAWDRGWNNLAALEWGDMSDIVDFEDWIQQNL